MAGEPISLDRSIRWPAVSGISDAQTRKTIEAMLIIMRKFVDATHADLENLRADVDTLLP